MMPVAPIPNWLEIAALFRIGKVDDSLLARPWLREGDEAFWLSKSACSLAIICETYKRLRHNDPPTIWIPDYFCNNSLNGVRRTGAKIVFYPVTLEMNPSWEDCNKIANENPPNIFVLVHYFGIPFPTSRAREFCKRANALFVEDAAHVLYPVKDVGEKGDIVLFSPHKLLPVPEGALMVIRSSALSTCSASIEEFKEILAKTLSCEAKTSCFPIYYLIKSVIKKIIPKMLLVKIQGELPEFDCDGEVDRKYLHHSVMHIANKQMLRTASNRLKKIGLMRLRRYKLWLYLLSDFSGIESLYSEMMDCYPPYLLALRTTSLEQSCEISAKLRTVGIPVQSWPDLSPEVVNFGHEHACAITLRNTIMTLPVHQSLSLSAISKIAMKEPFQCYFKLEHKNDINLVPFDGGEDEWHEMLSKTGRSSLLQEWHYGRAKGLCEGWRIERYIVRRNNNAIAILQVLIRSIAGLFSVVRINRGPLFFETEPGNTLVATVFDILKKRWNFRTRSILVIAPYVLDGPESLLMFLRLGYKATQAVGYGSSWIDLSNSLDHLRKQLGGKWRNQLVIAEKSGLQIDTSFNDTIYSWLIDKYCAFMQHRNFQGIKPDILEKLRESSKDKSIYVMRAICDNQPVAFILIAIHGSAATYLIGWNGIEGRKLNAMNFLLWNALSKMKQKNIAWFDLGGIDEVFTPEIANFKKNMNGSPYQLVGEFYAY